MEDDLLDPALNLTVPANRSFGAKMPEYAFRQLIAYNLKLLRKNIQDNPQDGILDVHFCSLPQPEVQRLKEFFRERENIPVTVNMPRRGASLPLVCVVNRGEVTDENLTFLGQRAGSRVIGGSPGGGRVRVRNVYAVGERRIVDVFVGTQDPNLTMYLHFYIKRILYSNVSQLEELYDVHNLSISGRDVQLDASIAPTLGYFKNLTLQFSTFFDWEGQEDGPDARLVSMGLLVDALKDGEPTLTPVPGEQG